MQSEGKIRNSFFSRKETFQTPGFLIALVSVLLCLGVQMVFSASQSSRPGSPEWNFFAKQVSWLLIGAFAGWQMSLISPRLLRKYSLIAWGFLLVLLTAVLMPNVGTRINGASRWLRFAGISVQPSELGRIILPVLGVSLVQRYRSHDGSGLITSLKVLTPLILTLPLVAFEPDLGATLFLLLAYSLALYFAGWPLWKFAICGIALLPCGTLFLLLKPYQLRRIEGFFATWQDFSLAPWQVRQSLMAFGSGGLSGTGIGNGWQKLSYLPEANTDFIFAVIGEELGLAGSLFVCLMWLAIFWTGRALLEQLPRNSFSWALGMTMLYQLVLQAMANIAVVTAMVPPKGVPHPFLSYGGTSMLVSLCSIGLIAGAAKQSLPTQSNR
ncbi:MAG: peptidoglycan glycosyltransferase FtsW [Planctomycetaceae bacterium]|jgi:cell division protein FtsW